jgi:hypothetical protein
VRLNESKSDAERQRIAGEITAVTMAVVYLRHPYVERGNSPDQIRPFMVGEAMERATAGLLKGDPATRAHVESKCAPVIKALAGPA